MRIENFFTHYKNQLISRQQQVEEAILGGSPERRFTAPAGTPHSLQISTNCITTPGVIVSGLIITEHPAAKAVEIFLAARISGKFQGDKAATTPTG